MCPVETPESEKVGLTLHLSKEARTDAFGNLSRTNNINPDMSLGFAANLIVLSLQRCRSFNDGRKEHGAGVIC